MSGKYCAQNNLALVITPKTNFEGMKNRTKDRGKKEQLAIERK